MEYKDYYKTLGVEKTASDADIKKAYRRLAMKYHPDKNPGDRSAEERFKDINEANQVLGDKEKRARYDQLGDSYFNYQQTGGAPGGFNWGQWTANGRQGAGQVNMEDLGGMFGGFSDFFRAIFGDAGGYTQTGRPNPRRAQMQTMQQPVTISLQEAFSGTTRTLQVGQRRLEIKIPPGAKTGTRVRVPGGVAAAELQADIHLVIEVAPDARFERKENDLYTDVTVDLYTAILGGQAIVATPAGNVTLTIPPGTQPGQAFRLSGRGMPKLRERSQNGDLYARVKVQIPKTLTESERDLFKKLAQRK
jgi:curved DNA-binding protein